MFRSILLLVALLVCSCTSVPDPVIGACEGQAQIIEMQGHNQVDLVNAYEADLIASYDERQKDRLDSLIATGQWNTPDKIKQLVLFFNENANRYRAESEARKAKFMASIAANVKSGQTLNKATREYLDSLDDKRKNLQAVIDALKPPAPGAGTGAPAPIVSPSSRPTV